MNKRKPFHIDLHTHSILSYDGGIKEAEYKKILNSGILDCVAITDHGDISFAQKLQKHVGNQVIVGEEIKTADGEIIGLFLTEKILAGFSAVETAKAIRKQGGLVYIPHPFETKRSSIPQEALERMANYIDIIEVFNARGFLRGKPQEAEAFAQEKNIALAAASDAHGAGGLGSAFSMVSAVPKSTTLVALLQKGALHKKYAPLITRLHPSVNKIRKKLAA